MKKIVSVMFLMMISLSFFAVKTYAQDNPGSSSASGESATLDLSEGSDVSLNIEPITIPLFGTIEIGSPYETLFSWASFAGNIGTIGLVIFWVYLLIRAAVKRVNAGSNADIEAESMKQLKSALIGAGLSIAFPIALTVIGFIVGAGAFWNWPKAFRSCPGDSSVSFYFQEVLKEGQTESSAESVCFGSTNVINNKVK